MWDPAQGAFWTGTNDGVEINRFPVPLDTATWSWLALREKRYAGALDWAGSALAVTDDASAPTSQLPDGEQLSGVTFSTASLTSTAQYNGITVHPQGVWLEGTNQLATALVDRSRRGDRPAADALLAQARHAQDVLGVGQHLGGVEVDGGIVAASSLLDTGFGFGYFQVQHVGATSWFVFGETRANPLRLLREELSRRATDVPGGSGPPALGDHPVRTNADGPGRSARHRRVGVGADRPVRAAMRRSRGQTPSPPRRASHPHVGRRRARHRDEPGPSADRGAGHRVVLQRLAPQPTPRATTAAGAAATARLPAASRPARSPRAVGERSWFVPADDEPSPTPTRDRSPSRWTRPRCDCVASAHTSTQRHASVVASLAGDRGAERCRARRRAPGRPAVRSTVVAEDATGAAGTVGCGYALGRPTGRTDERLR